MSTINPRICHQDRHQEMRAHITFGAIINKKSYLSETHLENGAVHKYKSASLAEVYCQYFEMYLPYVGRSLTKQLINDIYI